jgi:hypothetical protein
MTCSIFDAGNLVASFEREHEAYGLFSASRRPARAHTKGCSSSRSTMPAMSSPTALLVIAA